MNCPSTSTTRSDMPRHRQLQSQGIDDHSISTNGASIGRGRSLSSSPNIHIGESSTLVPSTLSPMGDHSIASSTLVMDLKATLGPPTPSTVGPSTLTIDTSSSSSRRLLEERSR
ncbi:hypothetical protein CFOL_v3_09913 [Cephalotus follicularis]|uniref:Uncharacterized protein n=1 Tax=Cephalotus follicularis TaxID=3775 RepID=A0A1Q3BF39_CEPFO|nr:hypothetical protein CFOL_v3_09913 [Cephalotus follicularis]